MKSIKLIVLAALFASIVMQIEAKPKRKAAPTIEPYSREWFDSRAKNRRLAAYRRSGW